MNFKKMGTERLFELSAQINMELQRRFDEISDYKKPTKKVKAQEKEIDPYKDQAAQLRAVAREVGKQFSSEPKFYRDGRKEGIRIKVVYGISDKKLKEEAHKELAKRVENLHLSNLVKIQEKDSISYAYGYPHRVKIIGFFFI